MEVIVISKEKFEEMVGKFNRLSDRVNEIIGKHEKGKLSRWMDNQDVCQQLRISPRTLQTLRDNGTLAYSQIGSWRTGARMPHGVAGQSNKLSRI